MNKIPLTASAFALLFASVGYFTGLKVKNSATAKISRNSAPAPLLTSRFSSPPQKPDSSSGKSPGPDIRDRELNDLFTLYESMTPEQLSQEIARWNNGIYRGHDVIFNLTPKRELALAYLAVKWGRTAPRQAMEQLKNMGILADHLTPGIIHGWAEKNPEAAAAYLSEHRKDIPSYKHYLDDVAKELALSSPERALKWASEISAEERAEIIPSLMGEIAEAHPGQLQKYIDSLTPEDRQNHALCGVLSAKMAANDWEAAMRWVDTLNGDQKNTALRSALKGLCIAAPEKAMAEFDKLEKKTTGLYASLTNGLAEKDPVLALQWLMKNAPEDIAADRTISVTGIDANYATPRLREYATELEDSPVKDALLDKLARQDVDDFWGASVVNYEERLSLADHINDPGKKENCVKRVLESWMKKDPKKTENWIKASSLPEELKQEQLKQVQLKKIDPKTKIRIYYP